MMPIMCIEKLKNADSQEGPILLQHTSLYIMIKVTEEFEFLNKTVSW